MTTLEQLAKWREAAFKEWCKTRTKHLSNRDVYIEGYLRAKQETEQIMKLAKFGR